MTRFCCIDLCTDAVLGLASLVLIGGCGMVSQDTAQIQDSAAAQESGADALLEDAILDRDIGPHVASVSMGANHACAVYLDGTVACWGMVWGHATTETLIRPEFLPDMTKVTSITVGYSHACAAKSDGTVWCWGANDRGQLGNNTRVDSASPVQVPGVTGVTAVFSGAEATYTCAKLADALACWGSFESIGFESAVVQLDGINASDVYVGRDHVCAARVDGSVDCWGNDQFGALGDNDSSGISGYKPPIEAQGLTGADSVFVAGNQSSAVSGTTAFVWGAVQYPDVWGSGSLVPAARSLPFAVNVMCGGPAVACALASDKTVLCWGETTVGALGDGLIVESRTVPASVTGLSEVRQLSCNGSSACAVRATGDLWCWGANDEGLVGNGTGVDAATPQLVAPK